MPTYTNDTSNTFVMFKQYDSIVYLALFRYNEMKHLPNLIIFEELTLV